ncbi:MAG: hypothetical protein V3S33_02800 [Gammaproteobacteria bacterium]
MNRLVQESPKVIPDPDPTHRDQPIQQYVKVVNVGENDRQGIILPPRVDKIQQRIHGLALFGRHGERSRARSSI